jgi:hypothetical protein
MASETHCILNNSPLATFVVGTMIIQEVGALWVDTVQQIKTALCNCLVSRAILAVSSWVLLPKDMGATKCYPPGGFTFPREGGYQKICLQTRYYVIDCGWGLDW